MGSAPDDLNNSLTSSGRSSASVVGRRLGPYVLRKLIAEGGMGTVYDAYHERLEREVALKTLRPGVETAEDDLQRFVNEARAAARLSHPNVVPVFDVGEHKGVRYLAMELVRGRSLHDRIRTEGALSPRDACEVLVGAAEGMQHAHDLGILHRDLKPANVLLQAPSGLPRVTDFGVARAPGNSRLTATGVALGTPNYMSPEQAMGLNDQLDARSDVWGLGAVLYEALTGRPPFNKPSQLETMQAVVNEPLTSPRAHRPELDADIEAIVTCCLTKEREARYPSARHLADDVRRYLGGQELTARPRSRLERALEPVRAHRLAAGVVALALLSVILLSFVAGALATRGQPGEDAKALADPFARGAQVRREALESSRAALPAPHAEVGVAAREALAQGLTWTALLERARSADGSASEAEEFRAGLDREAFERAARPLRAAIAWRLAQVLPAASPEHAQALVDAVRLGPRSTETRPARHALALLLDARKTRSADALAHALYRELLDVDDAYGCAATLRLSASLVGSSRCAQAGALAASALESEALDAEGRKRAELLVQLGKAFAGAYNAGSHRLLPVRGPKGANFVQSTHQGALLLGPSGNALRTLALGRSSLLSSVDFDGDGQDEVVIFPADPARRYVTLIAKLQNAVQGAFQERALACARGDLDGDGKEELAAVTDEGHGQLAYYEEGRLKVGALFPTTEPARPLSCVTFADLDGDGRQEIVCGSEPFDGRIYALACDPQSRTARVLTALPTPGVRRLWRLPPAAGTKGARLLAVVEGEDGAAGAWVVSLREGQLVVDARWDRAGAETFVAYPLVLGRTCWIVRGFQDGERYRFEYAALDELGSDELRPTLTVLRAHAPALVREQLELVEVDGDPEPEILLGSELLGVEGSSVSSAPPPKRVEPPHAAFDADLRAFRQLQALGLELGARELQEEVARAPHATLALAQADVEALLQRTEAERRRSYRAFARGATQAGREADEQRRKLGKKALERARELCEISTAGPDVVRARGLAAQAALLLGDVALAATHGQILGTTEDPQLTGIERDALASRIGVIAARARARRGLQTIDFGGDAQARESLALFSPLGARLGQEGVHILCSPHWTQAALVGLSYPRPLMGPLHMEFDVTLRGHALSTEVGLGLYEGATQTNSYLTGLRILLSRPRVSRRRPIVEVSVSGHLVGSIELPSFRGRYAFSLELYSSGGKIYANLEVRDAEGTLLNRAGWSERYAISTQSVYFGLISPQSSGFTHLVDGWATSSEVTLHSMKFASRRAVRWTRPQQPYQLFSTFAQGKFRQAVDGADAYLRQRPADYGARLVRGLARARLGDPQGAKQDLVAAFSSSPLRAAVELGENAHWIRTGPREDATAIGAALQGLSQAQKPVLRTLAHHLAGDLTAYADPSTATTHNERVLAAYLSFQRSGVDAQEQWKHHDLFKNSRWPYPWVNLPAVVGFARQLSDADYLRACTSATQGSLDDLCRLLRAVASRPERPEGYVALAQLCVQLKLTGAAEAHLWHALERCPDSDARVRGQLHKARATLLRNLQAFDEALAALRLAKELGAPNLEADFPRLYERLGS